MPKKLPENVRYVRVNGRPMRISEAARYLLINLETVKSRMQRGMTDVEALTTPVRSEDPRERNSLLSTTVVTPF
jgi:hypothetical protein